MTSPECRNGTERCAEALASLHDPDLVINFQGDALLTPPGLRRSADRADGDDRDALVATPAMRLRSDEVRALQAEEAAGRVGGTTVVTDGQRLALYFSKRLIPHLPAGALDGAMSPVRLHVGVYAYRPEALGALCRDAGQRAGDAGRPGAAALPRRRHSGCGRRGRNAAVRLARAQQSRGCRADRAGAWRRPDSNELSGTRSTPSTG